MFSVERQRRARCADRNGIVVARMKFAWVEGGRTKFVIAMGFEEPRDQRGHVVVATFLERGGSPGQLPQRVGSRISDLSQRG